MPFENYCWWHLILTCHGQWLPGDPRGFRSRQHRIHSSGDYKHRPPEDEHAGLHTYQQVKSNQAITIPKHTLATLGKGILKKAIAMQAPCLVLAVGPSHTHLLAATVNDWDTVKREAGRLKQAGSHAIGHVVPGQVWADGGKPIRIKDPSHQTSVFEYICRHEQEGAWVWRYDESGDGVDPDLRVAQDRLRAEFLEKRS